MGSSTLRSIINYVSGIGDLITLTTIAVVLIWALVFILRTTESNGKVVIYCRTVLLKLTEALAIALKLFNTVAYHLFSTLTTVGMIGALLFTLYLGLDTSLKYFEAVLSLEEVAVRMLLGLTIYILIVNILKFKEALHGKRK